MSTRRLVAMGLALIAAPALAAPGFVLREVTNDIPAQPLVTLTVTAALESACFAVEEYVPPTLEAVSIDSGGVYSTADGVVRWGGFTGCFLTTLTYRVTGPPGPYTLDGMLSVDGEWAFHPATTDVVIASDESLPQRPATVAAPVFEPAGSASLPVTVTLTCASGGAEIRYSTYGEAPTESDTLYTGSVEVVADTLIRARAFATNMTPSPVRGAWFAEAPPIPALLADCVVATNTPWLPELTVQVTQTVAGACWTYEEALGPGLTPTNVTEAGVYDAAASTIRWGPYTGQVALALSWQVTGLPGTYLSRGSWSVDGRAGGPANHEIVVTGQGADWDYPVRPGVLPPPVFVPPGSTSLPVVVSITNGAVGAEIRYTEDGTVPTDSDTLYTNSFSVLSNTVVRACAFATNCFPSTVRSASFVQADPAPGADVAREISTATPWQPAVTALVNQAGACWSYEEWLAPGLTPTNVNEGGWFDAAEFVIRWGAFTGRTSVALAYEVAGRPGTYPVRGRWSVDGRFGEFDAFDLTVAAEPGDDTIPEPPQTAATPDLSPPGSRTLPVDVDMTCATPSAEIRYTTDGALPSVGSALYGTAVHVDSNCVLRARAFKAGLEPSAAAWGEYASKPDYPPLAISRSIAANGSPSPSVTLDVSPPVGALSFVVTETLAPGMTAHPVTTNGLWNPDDRTLKWGPFSGDAHAQLGYLVTGREGVYPVWGEGSLDGVRHETTGAGSVEIGACEATYRARVRLWLQGAYAAAEDRMTTNAAWALAATAPYADDPRAVAAVPAGVVDWVFVELADTNGLPAFARSAFLRDDGWVAGDSGAEGIGVAVAAGNYYVGVRHRNHLTVRSAEPVAFAGAETVYDFTTGSNGYFGGAAGAVELEPGVWGMIAGDADGDGVVRQADEDIRFSQEGLLGILRGDLDLDGVVTSNETDMCTTNLGRQTAVTNGEVILTPALPMFPARRTVIQEGSCSFRVQVADGVGPVLWTVSDNQSGGYLESAVGTGIVYRAGSTGDCTDVVEAWVTNNLLGRMVANVISTNSVSLIGKAIVAAGRKSENDALWPITDYLADAAYNTLSYRGYPREGIQYFSPVTNQDVDANGQIDDIAGLTTLANLETAFTNWAAPTSQLFVYLVDHGGVDSESEGYFRLNPTETLTAVQLDGWLDELQDTWNTEVVVLLDFCHAGSFLPALTYTGTAKRVVIAACSTDEVTYFVAGGLVSFSDAFFSGILRGLDVEASFLVARDAMSIYQNGELDDDGSGAFVPGLDGANARNLVLGASFMTAQGLPVIGGVARDQVLTVDTYASLWAHGVVSVYPIDRVWCVIVPPSLEPGMENPVSNLPEVTLAYNPAESRYEGVYEGFSEKGVYKVIYYARNVLNGVSPPRQAYVVQEQFDERLVLLAAGPTNDAAWAVRDAMGRMAYHTFLTRRFTPATLCYLAEGPADINGDGTNEVYAPPTVENLAWAVTNWAMGCDKLTVWLIADGEGGDCRVNTTNLVSAALLDGWLDAVQATNSAAAVALLEFEGAGGFLDDMAAPAACERTTVAACGASEGCIRALNGRLSVNGALLANLFTGKSIGESFSQAKTAVRQAARRCQTPLLDETGDGVPDDTPALSLSRYIGSPFVTGADSPEIGTLMDDTE
ncbi:MAG: chitobiase/beta-hexosaminidase C-terminal domain-containing protein, partial [Kiritimatiellae bacterium]|nr:chitobiase/beta-hexosaminidase C-terminal domain-containing protein [Kiritimatiellia bacterium]